MDSVANFTPRIIFSDKNMKYFTLYTCNKEDPMHGTSLCDSPYWPGPMPALQPLSLSAPQQFSLGLHFNLISINYDHL